MRNVARAAYQGKQSDFDKFWPVPKRYKREAINPFGSTEEFRSFYDNLRKKYKFK